MHPDQLTVTAPMVRRLISSQFPEWRGLAVRRVQTAGTVSAIFRVGVSLAARFPLNPGDPARVRKTLEREARASREFLEAVPYPTPEPVAIGGPGEGFPLPWAVHTWLAGEVATPTLVADSESFAGDLARLIAAMRAVDTRGRPFRGGRGGRRGGEFSAQDAWISTCLARSEGLMDVAPLRRLWSRWRDLPAAETLAMTHGDLTPLNLLVSDGRLAGVLDAGGFGPADPALDLMCGWHLLEPGPRELLRESLEVGDAEWERGMAWAFAQAMGLPWYYHRTNPVMAELGRTTLARILAGTGQR